MKQCKKTSDHLSALKARSLFFSLLNRYNLDIYACPTGIFPIELWVNGICPSVLAAFWCLRREWQWCGGDWRGLLRPNVTSWWLCSGYGKRICESPDPYALLVELKEDLLWRRVRWHFPLFECFRAARISTYFPFFPWGFFFFIFLRKSFSFFLFRLSPSFFLRGAFHPPHRSKSKRSTFRYAENSDRCQVRPPTLPCAGNLIFRIA